MNKPFKNFEINDGKEIGLYIDWSVFLAFLKVDISFATLQAFRKVLEVTVRLQFQL